MIFSSSSHWQRKLYAIWLAEFMAIAGTNAIMPILPLYVESLGVQGERAVRMWAGVLFAAPAVTMALFGPVWGAASDRYGRKKILLVAMISGGLTITLMGVAQDVQQLAFLRAVQGALAAMIIPAATTLVATTAPRERAGYVLGLLRAVLYAGASVGPFLGGLVADSLGYRVAFCVAGALLLLAAAWVWLFVTEASQPGNRAPSNRANQEEPGLYRPLRRRLTPILGLSSAALLTVFGMRVLMRFGFHMTRPTVPLFIASIAPTDARVATVSGLIGGVSMAAGAVGAVALGRLGDRVSHRRVLVGCAALSAIIYLAHVFVSDLTMLLFLQVGATLAMSGILASIFALLAQVAAEGQEGIVYSVDQSVDALISGIGPLTGSALAASRGLRAPFLFAGGVFGLAGFFAARRLPRR